MSNKRQTSKEHLEFIKEMFDKGISLTPLQLQELVTAEMITREQAVVHENKPSETSGNDDFLDIIEGKVPGTVEEKKPEAEKEITSADWLPDSTTEHTKDFIKWINAINNGTKFQTPFVPPPYKPFELYCKQVDKWLAEGSSMSDFETLEDRKEYGFKEIDRIKQNSLYFLDKYLAVKEGDSSTGVLQYKASPANRVIAFLFDCGYSLILGKPRQIYATTTFGGLALSKLLTNKNFFLKMIAQDKDKVEEIFNDKIKYPFSELSDWLKPDVANDRDNMIVFARKEKKGTKKGINSKLLVVAPTIGAINGGAPNVVFIDEAGFISILGKMIKEARPTLFMKDPVTERLKLKRQIVIWGTGGLADVGGKSYEEEFYDALTKWDKGNHDYAIIPVFFNWTTRAGVTKEFYEKEKANYTVEGPEKEEKMVQFRQAYPARIADMFLTSLKTLVSIDWIEKNLERIYSIPHEARPIYGYFEPIYDESKPMHDKSPVPFHIIGAEFVPTEDHDSRASTIMFMKPQAGWINRYYKGTDPIASDNGYSKFATAILDAHFFTISCIVNYRDSNPKNSFLQSLLCGMYYDSHEHGFGCAPELVEANVGLAYLNYCEERGYDRHFTYRTELPTRLQGGNNIIGVDNKGHRNKVIIDYLYGLLDSFGERFCIDVIFMQLRTFVCKINTRGNETWEPVDKKKYQDDVLFAIVFAYICMLCNEHLKPKKIDSEQQKYKTKAVRVRVNGKLTVIHQKVKIHE